MVADPQVLQQLGVSLGDSLRVGTLELVVTGSATGLPVDFGIEWVAGPPLYISLDNLSETGLTEFGSLAQYRAWVGLPDAEEARQVRDRYREEFQRFGISIETAQDEAEGFASGFENLSRFLGLVGLLALLLGGIGVGSAVNVYLRERLPSMAILRCIGARRGTLLRAYLLQAVALGALGAGVGVLLGLCIQFSLPILLRDVLPFELSPTWHPEAVVAGWLLGAWVAVLFSLFPLLRVHGVSPLGALRAEVEDSSSPTSPQGVALAMVVLASLFGLCTFQLGDAGQALVVTLATAGALGLLSLVAMALGRGARALLPPSAPFPVRQGIAGLFRPGEPDYCRGDCLGCRSLPDEHAPGGRIRTEVRAVIGVRTRSAYASPLRYPAGSGGGCPGPPSWRGNGRWARSHRAREARGGGWGVRRGDPQPRGSPSSLDV